ncbi:LCP family protein [Nonomuraea sp. NPDC050783]|uniref:LCP family protein n=1 Tax=Nonomuraea sp. NPDC050783 TaxID=3154634 RepID=UPI003465D4B9
MMDDLKLLRELGGELEHQPPATLVRQRERLLRAQPRRRWANWRAAGLVAVATAAAVAVPTVLLAGRQPATPPAASQDIDVSGARNILVIGSDSVEGENAEYAPVRARQPGAGGRRADTIIILHVPADRRAVTAVSVPRDSLVRIPSCSGRPAGTGMINSAYDKGGLPCMRDTLHKLTGLTFQHTVEVDFTGFKGLVDALGGVEVTVPRPVDDRRAKLKLPAGRTVLNGEAALGWVRTRALGDGSDISRIQRQAQLLRAMVKKARSLIGDEDRLRSLLAEMRKSVHTNLSVAEMAELGGELARAELTMKAVPWKPAEIDRHRVQWKQPEARELFDSLK